MKPRRTIAALGVAASLLLHALLVTPLLLGFGERSRRQPDMQGASASRQNETTTDAMTAVFIDEDRAITLPQKADSPTTHFRLPQPALKRIAVARLPVPHLNLPQDETSHPASEANDDQPGHSMMFGRYMGQIAARVERIWLKPRSVPVGGAFACRVQITQDRSGNIQEVMLQKCNADPRWQVALVRAIDSASPLPAPPDAAVFANTLILEFDSDAYVAGSNELGFAPATQVVESVVSPAETAVPNDFSISAPRSGTVTRRLRPDGSIDLTIIGNNAPGDPRP